MAVQGEDGHVLLTASERVVLLLLGDGLTDEEISADLGLTLPAVRSRLRRFHEQTGLAGRRAVNFALLHRNCCVTPTNSTNFG